MRDSTVGIVVLACSLLVASLTATAQRPGKTVPRIGLLLPGFPLTPSANNGHSCHGDVSTVGFPPHLSEICASTVLL